MPEYAARNLPPIQRITKRMVPYLDRQLVHILPGEVVANVVIARAVIAAEISRQRRKNPPSRKLQETSIRDRVQAMAPGVVDLSLEAMSETLHGGELQAVVVTVRARSKLTHGGKPGIGRL